jgi:hypothetical protein
MKSDSQIQQDVLHGLKWNTRVQEADVGVEVDRAVVTLSGTVTDFVKKMAAQEAADRVEGVLDVVNDIQGTCARAIRAHRCTHRSAGAAPGRRAQGCEHDRGEPAVCQERRNFKRRSNGRWERRAERHAKHIQVDVYDGRVKLPGPVYSNPEREAVVGSPKYLGVGKIEDRQRVEGGEAGGSQKSSPAVNLSQPGPATWLLHSMSCLVSQGT